MLACSVADPDPDSPDPDPPDPHVFGPPGSGSTSQRYGSGSFFGSGSESFYHHAKIVRKNIDSYFFVTLHRQSDALTTRLDLIHQNCKYFFHEGFPSSSRCLQLFETWNLWIRNPIESDPFLILCCGLGSGIRCFFTPGFGTCKNQDPDQGWVKIKIRIRDRDLGWTSGIIFRRA